MRVFSGCERRIASALAVVLAIVSICGCVLSLPVLAKAKTATFVVTDEAVGTFYGRGTITLKGKPGYFGGTNVDTNTEVVSVWNEDGYDVTQEYKYKDMSKYISYKFTPPKFGTYTCRYAHSSGGSLDYIKTATIHIVDPKKASKTQPEFSLKSENLQVTLSGFDARATTTIYRSTSEKGTYKKLKTVNAASYTDNTVKKGKSYYYKIQVKVKSGSKTYSTKKSKALSAVVGPPAKPVITSVEIDPKDWTLTIKWKKQKGYDKNIHIYLGYSEENNLDVLSWGTSLATTNGDKTEYTCELDSTWNMLKSGETYYFYIWAYTYSMTDDSTCSISKGYKYKVPVRVYD